jgi:hypothetical protein
MKWAMRCSIHALNQILSDPDPSSHPNACDFDKFTWEAISYECIQIGFITNTRTMTVSIPDCKWEKLISKLTNSWGPHRRSFTL